MADVEHLLSRWQPWTPDQAATFFAALSVPWWIAGGWAIDLYLQRRTRAHEDIDILMLRRDQLAVRTLLETWDVQAALPPPRDEAWPFRRMPTIRRPVTTIGDRTAEGIPYLAPEIQLLYKAKGLRPKDEADFRHTLPMLPWDRRSWLRDAMAQVHPHHPWLDQLRDG
jgi:hypothetical protein